MKKSTPPPPPPPRTYEFSSSYREFLLFIIAIGVLLLALAAGNFGHFEVNKFTVFNWHLTYDCGYINRGLMGSIIKWFYGRHLETAELQKLIPTLVYSVFSFNIILLWLLLAPRIALGRFSMPTKWMLLAFAAVGMMSPFWKTTAYSVANMDVWVCLFALLALTALVFGRPILFAVFIILGFLTHRLMVPYAILLSLFALHAVWRIPTFRQRWRTYLCAISVIWLIIFIALSSSDNFKCPLEASKISRDNPFLIWANIFGIGYLNSSLDIFLMRWFLFPKTFLLSILYFMGPPVLVAALFIWGCKHQLLQFNSTDIEAQTSRHPPLLLLIGERLLPVFGVLGTMGLHVVVNDLARVAYWSWLGFCLALVYHVWFLQTPKITPKAQNSKPKKQATTLIPKLLAALMFTTAYGYAGSPMIWSNIVYPGFAVVNCRQWCAFPLTVNPLGYWFANHLRSIYGLSMLPFYATAEQAQKLEWAWDVRKLELRDGKLIVTPDFKEKLLTLDLTLPAGVRFSYTIRHDSKTTAPLRLTINDYDAAPTAATLEATTWQYVMQKESRLIFKVYGNNAEELAIKDFAFDITTPPKY